MTEKKTKIVTVRIPQELHKRASRKLIDTDGTFQDLLHRAIERFVAENSAEDAEIAGRAVEVTADEKRWVDALLRALRDDYEGKENILQALRSLLDVEASARSKPKQTKAR